MAFTLLLMFQWWTLFFFILLCNFTANATLFSNKPDPPTKPEFNNYYVSTDYTVREIGSCLDGTRVWVYEPSTTKPGGADVVVYMHGFGVTTPDQYIRHIEHLVKQGNYVLYPQIQEGHCELGRRGFLRGLFRRLGPSSPAKWVVRTAESANTALETLAAEYNHIYLYGHSQGGAFGMMFGSLASSFPQPIEGAVFFSPQPAGFSAIPGFVTTVFFFLFGEDTDVPAAAPETTYPVAFLHGVDDETAPLSDILPSYEALGGPKALYQAQSDSHGRPKLSADHLLALSGSKFTEDTLDWRYLWPGLDQVMAGKNVTELTFDMGAWSDGVPVKSIVTLF